MTACAGGVAWLSASEGGNIPLTVDPSFTGAAVKPSVKEMDTMRQTPKWVELAKAGKLPVKVEQRVYPRGGEK